MGRRGRQGAGIVTFNPDDSSTWPVTLTVQHIGAIFHKTPNGVRRSVARGRFPVTPIPHSHPLLWRRVDVIRIVEGVRPSLRVAV